MEVESEGTQHGRKGSMAVRQTKNKKVNMKGEKGEWEEKAGTESELWYLIITTRGTGGGRGERC